MNGMGPSPEANALTVPGEHKFNPTGKWTYMMNTRTATLQITLNPLFSPKPMNPCPSTAVSAETVRSFFLPMRYKPRGSMSGMVGKGERLGLTSIRKIGGKVMTTFTTVTRIEM